MGWKGSFRWRIALISALVSGIALSGFCLASLYIVREQKLEGVDARIRSFAPRLPGRPVGRGAPHRMQDVMDFAFGTDPAYLWVRDKQGAKVFRSAEWPEGIEFPATTVNSAAGRDEGDDKSLPRSQSLSPARTGGGGGRSMEGWTSHFYTVATTDGRWRMGMIGTADGDYLIAYSLLPLETAMVGLRNRFLLALPVSLFVVALGGWLVARRAMEPLSRIARTADQISRGDFSRRMEPAEKAPEIDQMVTVLNRMLDTMESSRRQAERFSSDASHEFKTPLTVMQGTLEEALRSAEPGSDIEQLSLHLMEEVARLKHITSSLLLLARADAGSLKVTPESFDPMPDLAAMLEDAAALSGEKQVGCHIHGPQTLLLETDRQLFRMVCFNLFSNAVKYNQSNGEVRVDVSVESGWLHMDVMNTGRGIQTDEQARIFDRFFRGTEIAAETDFSGSRGQGLGLSLARDITIALGGTLELVESAPGRTVFRLSLLASVACATLEHFK